MIAMKERRNNMLIRRRKRKVIFISDIKSGELFEWKGNIFIKTDIERNFSYACVNLSTGQLMYLSPTLTDVYEISATLEYD